MLGSSRTLTVTFIGNTAGLEDAFKRTTAGVTGLEAASKRMTSSGSSMTRAFTVPIVALGAASAKMAMDFQQSMTTLQTQAGASKKQVDLLSAGVLKMAGQVGIAPDQLAQGMYHVVSSLNATLPAATRVSTELKVMRIAAEGARTGHADLVDITNALDAAIVSGIKGVQNYSQAMGALNSITGAGDMTMQNLADALGTGLLAPMRTYGLTLQQVGGALAVFGDNNIRGQEAATKLASAVRIMAAPSKAGAAALATVGLSALQLANDMRTGGLIKALTDLKTHLKDSGDTAAQQGLILTDAFGRRQSQGVLVLMNQLERLRVKTQQVGDGANSFGHDWAVTQQTAAQKTADALATMKADLTRFGQDALPTLLTVGSEIVKDVDTVARDFASLPSGLKDTIIKGGLLVAAVGPAMKILGVFTGGVSNLLKAGQLAARLATTGTFKTADSKATSAARSAITGAGIWGARGPQQAGSISNPIVVALEAGNVAGLGGSAAAAQAEAGTAFRPSAGVGGVSKGGVLLPPGVGRDIGIQGVKGPATTAGTEAATAIETSIGSTSVWSKVGSVAMRALGVVGIGAFAAPLALGLGKAVDAWINADSVNEGKAFADKFTAGMPRAIQERFAKPLADATNKIANTLHAPVQGAATVGGGTKANPFAHNGPTPQVDTAALQKEYFNQGWIAGNNVVAGINSVREKSEPIVVQDFLTRLRELPAQARPEAEKVMLEYAAGLAAKGQLPKSAVGTIIAQVEGAFPGLVNYTRQQGLDTDKGLAAALKFTTATATLKGTLSNYRQQFGDWSISTKLTEDNINQNTATAMKHLHDIISVSTGQTRKDAVAELKQLQSQVESIFTSMGTKVAASAGDMQKAVADGSYKAYQIGAKNWGAFAKSVAAAVAAGALATQDGLKVITDSLNATLKAFGEKPLSLTQVQGMTPAQIKAVASGQVSSGAAASPHATGGLIQFGRSGDRGRDTIPVNFGGVPITVGSGEVGAVLTKDQQAFLNARTADVGGLPGVFQTFKRPHYMATGGMVGGGSALSRMVGEANLINSKKYPYVWGGGHNPSFSGPYDCSGAVSAVLHAGQLLNAPEVSGQLMSYGLPGPGPVTIYANPTHTFMSILGRFFGTHGSSGAGWYAGSALPGFTVRHPPVGANGASLGGEIAVPKVTGTGTMSKIVRAALGKVVGAANQKAAKAVAASFAGGQSGGGDWGTFAGSMSGSVEEQVFRFFNPKGFNKVAIAGMLGNAAQESNMTPNTPGGGFWQQVSNFGQGSGGSLLNQMQVMLPQILGIRGALNSAGSPGAAAALFMNDFEKPNRQLANLPHREAAAQAAYAAGYARGGALKGLPFAGSFGSGGTIPGPAGKPALAVVHGQETVIPATGKNSTLSQLDKAAAAAAKAIKETTRQIGELTNALKHAKGTQKKTDDAALKAANARLKSEQHAQTRIQSRQGRRLSRLALIPTQGVHAQITSTTEGNALTEAQNSGDTAAQQKALQAILKSDRTWLAQDKAKLAKVNRMLSKRGLTAKQRGALLADKLSLLQDIGTVEGTIGSNTSTLDGLTGSGSSSSADAALISAMQSLQASMDQQTKYMESIGAVETSQAIKAFSDVISGQIGGNYLSRVTGSAGDGSVARYGSVSRA